MKKEFIPYEQALELKQIEFDEPCSMQWTYAPELIFCTTAWSHPTFKTNKESELDSKGDCISAPTYSQAFRWFREKYNLIGLVEGGYDNGKNIFTYVIWDDFKDTIVDDYYLAYEEAELACLKKLIEIVKNK